MCGFSQCLSNATVCTASECVAVRIAFILLLSVQCTALPIDRAALPCFVGSCFVRTRPFCMAKCEIQQTSPESGTRQIIQQATAHSTSYHTFLVVQMRVEGAISLSVSLHLYFVVVYPIGGCAGSDIPP